MADRAHRVYNSVQAWCRAGGIGGEDCHQAHPIFVLREGQQRSAEGKRSVLDAQEHVPTLHLVVAVVVKRGKRPLLCRQGIGLLEKEEGFLGSC